MPDSLEKVLLIILGWLLGLLAPALVNLIKQKREDNAYRVAICSEMRSVARLLVMATHGVRKNQEDISDDHLVWMSKQLNRFAYPEDSATVDYIGLLLSLTFEERLALIEHGRKPGQTIGLQKYSIPVLDSRLSALYTFSIAEQVAFLGIRTQMGFVDDAVDRVRKFNDMTFQEHHAENYALVIENVTSALDDYARHAALTVDRIEKALVGLPKEIDLAK